MPESEVLARLEQAKKVYRTGDTMITALDSTTMEVRSRELVLVEGPSGSGKTTLISLIGCVIYPTEGEVFVRGTLTSSLNDRQLSRLRLNNIGFVFQNFNLIAPFSALDNVAFPLRLMGKSGREARREAMAQLEKLGLADRRKNRPRELSGGQKQRVAIARALATNPRILLCDEPTASLDHRSLEKIMSELRSLSREGKAVVVVTHDPRLEAYADRIISVEDGRIVDEKYNRD
ncbi:MAG: ABC transporter ATP-binding protein [Phaeodactylibacter sp.]|nr:ABC transporter ATP-binding protein [Phaeodactylibacter sp.]MCB9295266.1 ABC transporter ATP-binding protein [Lewinellaceae bacterium]